MRKVKIVIVIENIVVEQFVIEIVIMTYKNRFILLLLLALFLMTISNKVNSNINSNINFNKKGNNSKKKMSNMISTNPNPNNKRATKSKTSSNSIIKSNSKSSSNNKFRLILPKVAPHFDTRYLLAFGSDNCDHCNQMEPVLKRLEKDLGLK